MLRRPRRAVRHDDQPLAHLPELGADQRLEPLRHGRYAGGHGGRVSADRRDWSGQTAEIIGGRWPARCWSIASFPTGRKPVLRVEDPGGYRVRLTADHRVWTVNRGDVPAAELTVDDVVRLEQPGFGNEFVPQGFGELLGAALGDGCVSRGRRRGFLVCHARHARSSALLERLQGMASPSPSNGLNWQRPRSLRLDRCHGNGDRPARRHLGRSRCSSKIATVSPSSTPGRQARGFTDRVFALDRPSQAAILRGLFTTDGTVANYGEKSQYVALDSTSLDLLRQVQLLLLGFGVKAKIYENRRCARSRHGDLARRQGRR